jgi:hypothetical protein
VVAGFYYLSGGGSFGFTRSAAGKFKTINVQNLDSTEAVGINDKGAVIGNYATSATIIHGFLRTP